MRPPRDGLGSNRSSLETETPKEAVRIESHKNFKDADATKEAARPPKSAVQGPKDRL